MTSLPHRFPLKVYYEDTDVGGVVYYANYLRWFERSRTEMLAERGVDLVPLIARGVHFVVVEVSMKLLRPARYADRLVVETRVEETGRASFTLGYRVLRGEELLVTATTRMGAVSVAGGEPRPTRIPEEMRRLLTD